MNEMPQFPPHKAGLHLEHNQHRNYYEPLGEHLADDMFKGAFATDEERALAIATDELWTLQWYPETPVGFRFMAAATWDGLMDRIKEFVVIPRSTSQP